MGVVGTDVTSDEELICSDEEAVPPRMEAATLQGSVRGADDDERPKDGRANASVVTENAATMAAVAVMNFILLVSVVLSGPPC